ncbi:ABC transporter ATP-binding protein [Azospirillum sp. INR13]|uniref:ABC transporter ATP-binding protein n=1 Tax=Azospirillum sp. INR13 TaxID=2596919 RepID=UPI0018926C7E|nr:ABC transporter ATP-binding protein [Azospirillum sp. INR13]MBF5095240.1 ABC transporter ATP-binding protein [Azospirillum sp. INR13]MBF5095605.1 ABC transporter ATP-binding protein [Azospirillum sp. INR13]MBF5095633.1 ABC transporter ATP-binding protein [Azospirillum sp. INR13]
MPDGMQTKTAHTGTAMLEIADLHGYYGESHVLHGVSLEVRQGEVVTLLGRNGAGKTSTMRAIMGIMGKRTGSIRFQGQELIGMAQHRIPRLGIGYVPEERGIFSSLSVDENLTLPPVVKEGGMTIPQIHDLFPNLKGRGSTQGTRLSGGEQQMLAIARILRTGATMILLDEPTEGLAPVIIEQIGVAVRALKARGFTIVLVEQNFRFAATIADRHYVMEEGHVVDMIPNDQLEANMDKLHTYLGV